MGARTKARKRALDICYESELRGLPLDGTLAQRVEARGAEGVALNPYTVRLVEGVVAHQPEIDALLADVAVGWTLDRMPAVDRNALRIGVFEVMYVDDVPDAVAVSEAMNLVSDLSTDDSPSFVNGVLGNIVRNKPARSA